MKGKKDKCTYKSLNDYLDSTNWTWYFPGKYQCRMQEEIVTEESTYTIMAREYILRAKENKMQKKRWRTNGITIAPRSDIARPVAPLPFSCGTKRPLTTSLASGFAYPSSAQKHAAIVNTRKAIKNSSFLTW